MLEEVLPCKTTLSVNATCLSLGAHGILVHAHIKTPLTTMGTQALFVVKLRLIAFKMGTTRGLKQVITQCRCLTKLAHKVCANNVSMKSMYPSK